MYLEAAFVTEPMDLGDSFLNSFTFLELNNTAGEQNIIV